MSNIRQINSLQVIRVNSLFGQGISEDPSREIIEYFTMDGDFLAIRDTWAEERKQKDPGVELLRKSYPLSEYITYLLQRGDIVAKDYESTWEIAYKYWKADREKLNKYKHVINLLEETEKWRELYRISDKWEHLVETVGHPCVRCGSEIDRNQDKLCFDCWEKLHRYSIILEETWSILEKAK